MRGATQTGGKILGQGVQGCVFQPQLKTKKQNNSTQQNKKTSQPKVGKIEQVDEAQHEQGITKDLEAIPKATEQFVLVDSLNTPLPRTKQIEPNLQKCEAFQKTPLQKLAQLTMPFGGRTLRSIPRTTRNLHQFTLAQHLLEGGALLLTAGVVHGDLHQNNVLIDSPSKARLIDFGVAWRPSELTLANLQTLQRQFNPSINQEPPEISWIHGISNADSQMGKEQIYATIEDQKLGLTLLSKVFGLSKEALMNRLRRSIEQSKSLQEENFYSYQKLYWSKVDAWAYGMILLTLFIDLSLDSSFTTSDVQKEKAAIALKVIRGLSDVDAAYRLDAAEALEMWAPNSPILQLPTVKAWLIEQKKQRSQMLKN